MENIIKGFIEQQRVDNSNKPKETTSGYNPYRNKYDKSINPINYELSRDDMFNQLDHFTYSKEWKKLEPCHKIIKIREYYEYMPTSEFKQHLLNRLSMLIMAKKLNKNIHVIYDKNKRKIISIPALKFKLNFNNTDDNTNFDNIINFNL